MRDRILALIAVSLLAFVVWAFPTATLNAATEMLCSGTSGGTPMVACDDSGNIINTPASNKFGPVQGTYLATPNATTTVSWASSTMFIAQPATQDICVSLDNVNCLLVSSGGSISADIFFKTLYLKAISATSSVYMAGRLAQ